MEQNRDVGDSDYKSEGSNGIKPESKVNRCESLEEGMHAFIQWLNSDDKGSLSENPIVLLKLINDTCTILYDTGIQTELEVAINNGVPYCKYCNVDDCAHVGFSIEAKQLLGHRMSGDVASADDLVV